VLEAAGAGPAQVVRTTVYLTDLADFATVNDLYAAMFGEGVSPARACVQVAALPKGAKVEIDAVAVLG
jgi:enamine deaminase RidA (YjgF/YER057c/UK114 family)